MNTLRRQEPYWYVSPYPYSYRVALKDSRSSRWGDREIGKWGERESTTLDRNLVSEADNLPTLSRNGFWHTQHWVGAVLTASRLATPTEGGDINLAETQKQQVEAFLNSALKASKALLKMDEMVLSFDTQSH